MWVRGARAGRSAESRAGARTGPGDAAGAEQAVASTLRRRRRPRLRAPAARARGARDAARDRGAVDRALRPAPAPVRLRGRARRAERATPHAGRALTPRARAIR